MNLKNWILLGMVLLLISPVMAYGPYYQNITVSPTGGILPVTVPITMTVGLSWTNDSVYVANSATNNRWYWFSVSDGIIRDVIDSCEGDTSCTYYPNASAYSGDHRLQFNYPCTNELNVAYPQATKGNIGQTIGSIPGYYGSCAVVSTFAGTANGTWDFQTYVSPTVPNINFTATPLTGSNPLTVNFTDTSNQTNEWRYWNFGDGTYTNASGRNALKVYQYPGVYTVTMDSYSSVYGAYTLTKTNYITVTVPSNFVLNVDIKDSQTGAYIQNTTMLGIKNTTSGVWRNNTPGGVGSFYFDSTDPGNLYPLSQNQTVVLAACGTGYSCNAITVTIPYNEYQAIIPLVKSNVVNETGKGTLAVTVTDNKHGKPVSGITLTLDTNQIGYTNTAGSAMIYNVTTGNRWITATDNSGRFQTAQKSTTITAGTTTMESMSLVLIGETPIPLQIPTTSAGDTLVDTDGDGIPDTAQSVVGNYTPGQLNQKGSSGLMEMIGMVINLWPLILLFAFFKFLKECTK
jgi:PKD repeat protein